MNVSKSDPIKTFDENMVESMKKILIPLWSSGGRDFQIIMPIVYFLEKVKQYEVKIISIWDWHIVDNFKPDLILFANTIGGSINFKLLKYLKFKGYKVISLVSEGNFIEKNVQQFIWGWNKDKILYEDANFLWSHRCRDMLLKYYPELKPKLAVSGAVGFDRYKIYQFMSKNDFLNKYHLSHYNKIIGYACWAFDVIRTEEDMNKMKKISAINRIEAFRDRFGINKYAKYLEIKSKINYTLRVAIENNSDTLFILKLHPGTLDDEHTEIIDLDYPNVLVLKYEEDIADIINVCDIWMGFDSTTALEAWLLNKSTINLFPPDFEEDRALNFEGSVSVNDYKTLQGYIDEYYLNGKIQDFEDNKSNRKTIIEQIIQWDDGLNHVRVGEKIVDMIEHDEKHEILKDKLPTRIKLYGIHLLIKYSKYIKKIKVFNNKNYILYQVSKCEIQRFKNKYYYDLDEFHANVVNNIIENTSGGADE